MTILSCKHMPIQYFKNEQNNIPNNLKIFEFMLNISLFCSCHKHYTENGHFLMVLITTISKKRNFNSNQSFKYGKKYLHIPKQ